MQGLIITLDGPAGSGKSTAARRLAQRLDMAFLDTGAMYRGLTAACLDAGLDPARRPEEAAELARRCRLRFDWRTDPPRLHLERDGVERDVTGRLRDPDVTGRVSDVAAMPAVRRMLVEAQRLIARDHPRLVTEGRDQGSVVFPDAAAKFYLDATAAVRARRRARQLREAGHAIDEARILGDMRRRDRRDRTREDGPLLCPPDAVRLDTTELTLDEVVERLQQLVAAKVAARAGSRR